MKKKSKRKHRSEGDKYYIPYLPDEVFNNLTPELKELQREYRRYHRVVHDINKRIESKMELRKKLMKEITEDTKRLKERANDDYDDRGYEDMMLYYYQKISHLYEVYNFDVYVTKTNRTSKSYKEKEFWNRKKIYAGKEIGEVFTYYSQVKSKDYDYSLINGKKKLKGIALGTEEVMKRNLGLIYDEDWMDDDIEDVKSEWKVLIRAYSNYFLTTYGWSSFKEKTHSKEKITEWCIKNGVNNPNGDFHKWLPKEG